MGATSTCPLLVRLGWMQFIPSSWRAYGVDANKDGRKDPYNPVDAIFAAARYLKAAGYEQDVRRSIFAYNHADWYVDSVMLRARLIAGVPADLVGSLTGLTEGRFPVAARARYADDLQEKEALKRVKAGQNAANVVETNDDRRTVEIYTQKGAPVVATNDGQIKKIGANRQTRALHRPPRRLRQPLPLHRPRHHRQVLPRTARGGRRPSAPRAPCAPTAAATPSPPPRHRAAASPTSRHGLRRPGRHRLRRPGHGARSRSACSPTRTAPGRASPAAWSS